MLSSFDLEPSIRVKNSVFNFLVPSESSADLRVKNASTSSMKIMDGWLAFNWQRQTKLLVSFFVLTMPFGCDVASSYIKKVELLCEAMHLAMRVLPDPGGQIIKLPSAYLYVYTRKEFRSESNR